MTGSGEFVASRILNESEIGAFPTGLSFFGPHVHFFVKQTLAIGGEAYLSRGSDGELSGVFIHDPVERVGSVFTSSREVFEYFFSLKSGSFLFAEVRAEHECETYDIYTVDLAESVVHRFGHEITIAEASEADEIMRFMRPSHPRMNGRWVKVALSDGDKCFIVRLENEIAGLGWVSLVNGSGRLHSLFVAPLYRRMGIGEDILHARLLWLKSKGAKMAYSEILRDNIPSVKTALKAKMAVSGQVFIYHPRA